jgi:hypothetical protein
MKGLIVAAGVLLALVAGATAGRAASPEESATGKAEALGTLWAYPPGLELVIVPGGGYGSFEIGVMRALSVAGGEVDTDANPRLGLFLYPGGGGDGAALYAGLASARSATVEVGLWYIWRGPPGGASFRIGAGWVQSIYAIAGGPGIGASVGLAF